MDERKMKEKIERRERRISDYQEKLKNLPAEYRELYDRLDSYPSKTVPEQHGNTESED